MPDPTAANPVPAEPFLARFHGLRRLAGKLQRKWKQLRHHPDRAPWVMRPSKRWGIAKTFVDFIFGLDYISPNSELAGLFHEAFAALGMSVLLVNNDNLDRAQTEIQRGWLRPHVYLDLCSAANDSFWKILESAAAAGIHCIADPKIQPIWTIKAASHPRLETAGLPLPQTVIIRKDEPDRDLTPDERARVGERCVIKPSFGVAGRGTVMSVTPTREAIASARQFNRQDDWLIQQMITWTRCGARPAYLRAYNVLGHRTLLWWAHEDGIDKYDLLTWNDLRQYDLLPALDLIDRLTQVTQMEFFSTEIAITSQSGPDRFVLIDYCNDQCDMDPSPGPGKRAVPAEWVKWVCHRFAEYVHRRKHGIEVQQSGSLWLAASPADAEIRAPEPQCA